MNVQSLIETSIAPGCVNTIARVAVAARNPDAELPAYYAALNAAIQTCAPPFEKESYADTFFDAADNGQWLATSLIVNAEREGDGAGRLWSLAACAPNDKERALLKRHAIDESGHSLAYLRLLDLTFPDAVTPQFRSDLNQLSPHYTTEHNPEAIESSPYARTPTIDDYIQMNIAEIRTTIHHLMQRKAICQHCPTENLPRILPILDFLMRDELTHVAYTAELIDAKVGDRGQDDLNRLFSRRMSDFSDITRDELTQGIFE